MRRSLLAPLLGLLLFVAALPALAVQPDEVLSDPALEARARTLSAELRCMVCQNQSIDDSDADLARDLRVLVRERLTAGDSDEQVLDYVVARYGEFVLLKPRLNLRNALLWAAPLLALLFGVAAVFRAAGRRRVAAPVPLSVQEAEALDRILSARAGGSEDTSAPKVRK
jgi:cytochrome c-type biogenesis protein CcmH